MVLRYNFVFDVARGLVHRCYAVFSKGRLGCVVCRCSFLGVNALQMLHQVVFSSETTSVSTARYDWAYDLISAMLLSLMPLQITWCCEIWEPAIGNSAFVWSLMLVHMFS